MEDLLRRTQVVEQDVMGENVERLDQLEGYTHTHRYTHTQIYTHRDTHTQTDRDTHKHTVD